VTYDYQMSEQVDQFFNPDGTLINIPVKSAKKIAVLNKIAGSLSPDTKYTEKELNAEIAKFHADTAAIRRYMIEYGILERDRDSVYWVSRYAEPEMSG
jgi:hypothetical protein